MQACHGTKGTTSIKRHLCIEQMLTLDFITNLEVYNDIKTFSYHVSFIPDLPKNLQLCLPIRKDATARGSSARNSTAGRTSATARPSLAGSGPEATELGRELEPLRESSHTDRSLQINVSEGQGGINAWGTPSEVRVNPGFDRRSSADSRFHFDGRHERTGGTTQQRHFSGTCTHARAAPMLSYFY